MRTCRRVLLDKTLGENISLMQGRVLDIGGVKAKGRGNFKPPTEKVISWEYVNIEQATDPDYCCDASDIPVESESFDTIVMTELLEYVESPLAVLAEAFRILKPGGNLLLSVPFLCPVHGDWQIDRYRLTKAALVDYIDKARFTAASILTMGSVFSVGHDIFYAAFSYAAKKPQGFCLKTARQILRILQPACLWIDRKCLGNLSNYVTTGYFAVLRKPKKYPEGETD